MSRISLLGATSLLGKELLGGLEHRPDLWSELILFASREDQVGAVSEAAGAAAIVQRFDPAQVAGSDLLVVCEPEFQRVEPFLESLRAQGSGPSILHLSYNAPDRLGPVRVSGFDKPSSTDGTSIAAHPAALLLTHLLAPLADIGLQEATATMLLPASLLDDEAFEEMLGQARSVLSFAPVEGAIFRRQIVFNLAPGRLEGTFLERQLGSILGDAVRTTVQVLQAGIFHSLSASLCCRFKAPLEPSELAQALATSHVIDAVDEPLELGPIDAAGRDQILLGPVSAATDSRTFWIWAVMDNLVFGAKNALGLVEANLAER